MFEFSLIDSFRSAVTLFLPAGVLEVVAVDEGFFLRFLESSFCVKKSPVPGIPIVARLPRQPTMYFVPRGPADKDIPRLLKFNVKPGAIRTRLKKRNPIVLPFSF